MIIPEVMIIVIAMFHLLNPYNIFDKLGIWVYDIVKTKAEGVL
jgi:hypothetical protein